MNAASPEPGRRSPLYFSRFVIHHSAFIIPLTLLAAYPVLRQGAPSIGDGLIHYYRLVEFDSLLRQGILFPRWAPDFAYGFGFPVFNYYPPLTYYLGAFFHLLGLSYGHSLAAVYVLAHALAVSGAFLLGTDLTAKTRSPQSANRESFVPFASWRWKRIPAESPGLLAAAAYALAPYLYFNIFGRGALPELLALGLLPWALWAAQRFARSAADTSRFPLWNLGFGVWDFSLTLLFPALLLLTNLPSAIITFPLIALWMLFNYPSGMPLLRRFLLLFEVWILIFGVTSFFWLPAVFELRHVQIARAFSAAGDLRAHFLTPLQLLGLPHTFDPRLAAPDYPPALSLGALLLLIAYGVSLLASRPASDTRHLAEHPERSEWASPGTRHVSRFPIWSLEFGVWSFFLILTLLTLPVTLPLWQALPLARFIQFPWRLLGPASLFLALLAARSTISTSRSPHHFGVWNFIFGISVLPLAVLFFLSLPWTFASAPPVPSNASTNDILNYELTTEQLGTTATGEYLPIAVDQLPAPTADRFPLPDGVTRASFSVRPTRLTATLSSPEPWTATFNLFYFPGWAAALDGVPVSLGLSSRPAGGLLTLDVPAGTHTLVLTFGSTPARRAGAVISFISLLALIVLVVRGGWRVTSDVPLLEASLHPPRPTSVLLSFVICSLVILLLFLRAAFIDGRETIISRSRFDGETVAGVDRPLSVNFEDRFQLLGLDAPARVVSGRTLDLTLYLRPLSAPDADYVTAFKLLDSEGNQFGQSDNRFPGGLATSHWPVDRYAADRHRLALLPGTPPGLYTLMASLYRADTFAALTAADADGLVLGPQVPVAQVEVARASRPPAPETLDAHTRLVHEFGDGVSLLGYSLDVTGAAPGQRLPLIVYWQAGREPLPDLAATLRLTHEDTVREWTLPLARAGYPTSQWQAREVVRGVLFFRLPADFPPGPAELTLDVAPPLSGAPAPLPGVILGSINVKSIERTMTTPAPQFTGSADFENVIRLVGYDLETSPGQVALTLHWQALAPMQIAYVVFTHLLNADGSIAAQSDSPPLDGARPTPGWLPGEYLADAHTVSAPRGRYTLEIGLYDSVTGERLGKAVEVGDVEIP